MDKASKRRQLGIAVIGSGRIGSLRARLASRHPSVHFLAVSDINAENAKTLAERAGADVWSTDNAEIISRPEVDAVIVSTPEHEHVEPVCQALELGKPVLMEKPLALTLADADQILAAVERTGGNLRIGYIRRFKRCFARAKQQVLDGHLGTICGGTARVYNTRAQAMEILKRNPEATPVVDVLTYFVDLMLWFNAGNPPVEAVARAQHGVFKKAGFDVHDLTWAIVTLADGAVINLGISYALPAKYPTLGQADRVELLGSDGTIMIDDDHREHILYTEKGVGHAYVPGHTINVAFSGSNPSGDWALDEYWGPLGNETRQWLDHLVTGRRTAHATPREARLVLETTIAIQRSVTSGGKPVRLPLET
jgi:predicted dehydrogenase